MAQKGKSANGLGDILGKVVSQAVKKGKDDYIRDSIGDYLGATVADKANALFEKSGIQKNVDGTTFIKIPYFMDANRKAEKYVEEHPGGQKIFVHFFQDSVKKAAEFYDAYGRELYHVKKSSRNLKHIILYQEKEEIGEVNRKRSLLRKTGLNPYKYAITLRGKALGLLEVKEIKLIKTCAVPDFAEWSICEKGISGFELLDKKNNVLASIYYPGEYNYILDCSDHFDPELLILSFMAIRMRDEEMK